MTIQFKPDLNPKERYLQKQLGFEKYYVNTTCEIPLNRTRIEQIPVQGMIVTTTKRGGILKFQKQISIREH